MDDTPKTPASQKMHERARVTRLVCVQALFQSEATQASFKDIEAEFLTHRFGTHDYPCAPIEDLFKDILHTFNGILTRFDVLLQDHMGAGSDLMRQEPVLRAALRCAVAEMQAPKSQAPAPIVISEYVDIARGFSTDKHAAFVNSVLDKAARTLRCSMTKSK